ncbi:MAG: TonB-dependent receptor [Magnetococcales bacterium]|nr:TonB-dependent receptor [Magnetococcales bacterium]
MGASAHIVVPGIRWWSLPGMMPFWNVPGLWAASLANNRDFSDQTNISGKTRALPEATPETVTSPPFQEVPDSKTLPTTPEADFWLAQGKAHQEEEEEISLAAQYQFIGPRHRDPSDDRDKLGSDATLDLTATIHDLAFKGLALRFGVKNIFDTTTYEPAPINTYIGDYPRTGRMWWLSLIMDDGEWP